MTVWVLILTITTYTPTSTSWRDESNGTPYMTEAACKRDGQKWIGQAVYSDSVAFGVTEKYTAFRCESETLRS